MLVYFPPKAEDLACIPGTRSRLHASIQVFKRAEGLLNPIDDLIQQGIQRQFNKIYTYHNLSNHVDAGNEIHLQPFFHHVLGVSEAIIREKDQFFSLPKDEVTAESVYNFLSTLNCTVEKTIQDLLKESIIDFSQNIASIEKSGFLSGLLDDLERGSFVQLIKSINDSFDISGINYKESILDENDNETGQYQWNQSDLYSNIFNILSTTRVSQFNSRFVA